MHQRGDLALSLKPLSVHSKLNIIRPYQGSSSFRSGIGIGRVEETSWQALREVLENPELVMSELIENQSRSLPFIDEEEASVQRNIKLLVEQEKRLVRLYALGEVDEAFIIQDSRSLKVRRGFAESRLNEITKQRLQLANLHDDQSKIADVCRMVSAKPTDMTFENKRLAIEALRTQVWVFQDRVEVRGYLPTSSLTIGETSACMCNNEGNSIPFQRTLAVGSINSTK